MPVTVPLVSLPAWSAILEVQDPDGRRTRHPFRHPRVQVGRKRDNDLSLADEGVSHRHCEFVSADGFFVVRDLGSHNGTFVNEERVSEARLRDGDEVRIGATRIKVALQGQVKKPRRSVRWLSIAVAVAAIVVVFASLIPFWQRERETRLRFLTEIAQLQTHDPCALPLTDLSAVDAQLAGRSIAIGRISKAEEEADLALLALYRRKLELYPRVVDALQKSQQIEREGLERVSRAGQRFITAKDRKLAAWVEGILQEREKAADELLQGIRGLVADTQSFTSLIEAVVVRREQGRAQELASFRFGADLRALQKACQSAAEKANADATRPVSALAE